MSCRRHDATSHSKALYQKSRASTVRRFGHTSATKLDNVALSTPAHSTISHPRPLQRGSHQRERQDRTNTNKAPSKKKKKTKSECKKRGQMYKNNATETSWYAGGRGRRARLGVMKSECDTGPRRLQLGLFIRIGRRALNGECAAQTKRFRCLRGLCAATNGVDISGGSGGGGRLGGRGGGRGGVRGRCARRRRNLQQHERGIIIVSRAETGKGRAAMREHVSVRTTRK